MNPNFPIFNLPNDVILNIIVYFNNYQLLEFIRIVKDCKAITLFNSINSSYFLKSIEKRPHPIVFNLLDNYCNICNRVSNTFFYLTKENSSIKKEVTFTHCFHGNDTSHGIGVDSGNKTLSTILKNMN